MLKDIPPEYTEELEYYKSTGYFTSTLILNATMVFMEELIDNNPVDERAVTRLIEKGVTPEDAADWKRAYKEYHEIEKKVKEFSDFCWPDIKRINNSSNCTRFRFAHGDLTLLSMYTAGRILMSIGPKIMDGKIYISIIGDGSASCGKEGTYEHDTEGKYSRNTSPCGFQGIHANKEEALKFIDTIMHNWDRNNYCEHKSNVSIC